MTDANVTPLRPAAKDRTAAERQRRFRRKRKAGRSAAVTGGATPPVTPPVPLQRNAAIDVAAYTAAIVLAGAAAFFSIKGMVVLFPGAPMPVVEGRSRWKPPSW
jgi:hypothetical protein